MGLFEHFPYTNFQNNNLDWIIKKMNEFVDYINAKEEEWQEMQADWDQIQSDFAQIQADFAQIQIDVAAAIDGIAPAIADGLREAEAAMQAQYDAFIQQYQETWNIVQTKGHSTTDVMSQDAVTNELNDLDENKFDKSNVKQTTGEATNQVMSQKAVTDALALKGSASDVEALQTAVAAKVAKADIRQTTGSGEDLVMSQKAVSDALELKLNANAVKQVTGSSTTGVMSQKATTDALGLKIAKADIRQTTGYGEDLVMSQEAITEALALKGDASDVGTLQTQMVAVQTAVASKASQDSLDALATIVGALSNNAVEVYPTAVSHGSIPWSGITFTAMPANKYYTFSTDITDQDVAWLPAYGTLCTIIRFAAYALAYQDGKLYYAASVADPNWKQIVNSTDLNTALNLKLDKSAVKQVTGQSTTDVMSQKALTDIIKTTMVYNPTEITSDNYQEEGISDVSDIEYNYLTRFDSTITALMVTGLPVYGADVSVMKYADADSSGDPITVCYVAYSGADCYQSADGSTWKKAVFQGDAPLPVIIDCTSGSLPSGWTYEGIDALIGVKPVIVLWSVGSGKIASGLLYEDAQSSNTLLANAFRTSTTIQINYMLRIMSNNTISSAYTIFNITTANPTLAGTEAALEGLQIGDTKYSNKMYRHVVSISQSSTSDYTPVVLYNRSADQITTIAALDSAIGALGSFPTCGRRADANDPIIYYSVTVYQGEAIRLNGFGLDGAATTKQLTSPTIADTVTQI